MIEALSDLEQIVQLQKVPMTIQEAKFLMEWQANARRDAMIGMAGSSYVTLLATHGLSRIAKSILTPGIGIFCGLWTLSNSIESCINRILSLEGSHVQRVMANAMLTKYNNDPWALQRFSKHFYSEDVFEDSSVDKPKFRWRFRNFYGDPSTHSQGATPTEIITSSNKNDVQKMSVESKQISELTASNATEDPFDCIFGFSGCEEKSSCQETPNILSRREIRREKRRRRHQRLNQDDSEN